MDFEKSKSEVVAVCIDNHCSHCGAHLPTDAGSLRISRTSIHFCYQCGAHFIAARPWGATYEFSEMKDGKLVDDAPCTVTVDNYKNPAELEEPFKDAFCRFVEAHELQAGSLVRVRTTLRNQNAIDVPAAEEKVYCIGSVNWVKDKDGFTVVDKDSLAWSPAK